MTKKFLKHLLICFALGCSFSCNFEKETTVIAASIPVEDNTTIDDFAGIDSIENIKASTAIIKWTNHELASHYLVMNITDSITYQSAIQNQTSFFIFGLTGDTEYKFIVKAVDSLGNLDSNTNEVTFTTLPPPSAPETMTLLSPSSSPNYDRTPTIRLTGVQTGYTVKIYSDNSMRK